MKADRVAIVVLTKTAAAIALVAFTVVCGDPTAAPDANGKGAPQAIRIDGSWVGSESDRLGPALLTWELRQSGPTIWGTATMRPVDASDGSCASCHKSKNGWVRGSISATTLTLMMYFAAGQDGDPTPACSITLNGSASQVTTTAITGTYSGSDPCEGTFDGTMLLTRKP